MRPRESDSGGFVSLVGAGPGSPDLITVRGARALQRAEVVLYDALLEPAFAALFPARRIAVGKRCGGPGTAQEEIHRLLVEEARAGRRVVRLKGGDPLIFGRGGEEARALEAAGVPFEVIPGISALQAGAAAAGFPLTHRGVSRRVTLLEARHLLQDPAGWRELAARPGTLAVYMGTRSIQGLARGLLDCGADAAMPVALVERAQCPGQATTFSTLALAAAGALHPRTEGPGMFYLGDVLNHRFHSCQEPPNEAAAAVPGPPREACAGGGRRARRAG